MSVNYYYSTGRKESALPELRRALGQYARHNDWIKIGITTDSEQRFAAHQREGAQFSDSWRRMIIIFETSSDNVARFVENELIGYVRLAGYSSKL